MPVGRTEASPRTKPVSRRERLGFLLANLHAGAANDVLEGTLRAARRLDVDLICYPGGRLGARADEEAHRNAIYDLAGPESVDGILSWASSMAGASGVDEVTAFHARFAERPFVTLAQKIGRAPAVLFDAYGAMRTLVAHALEKHGFRRLAFLRGPAAHPSAEDRFRAFLDGLRAADIEPDPRLLAPPGPWDGGPRSMAVLLDARGLRPGQDFDALLAASDLQAFAALRELRARGFEVPAAVAVLGFNDSREARIASPALTSARPPFGAEGARGLETLLSMVRGEGAGADVVLPVGLVVRSSCGCPSVSLELARGPREGAADREFPEKIAGGALAAGADGEAGTVGNEELARGRAGLLERVGELFERETGAAAPDLGGLVDAWIRAIHGGFGADQSEEAYSALTDLAARTAEELGAQRDPELLHDLISLLRAFSLERAGAAALPRIEALAGLARVAAAQAARRLRAAAARVADERSEALRAFGLALLMARGLGGVADALAERLPALGIPAGLLVLYEPESGPQRGGTLILAFDENGRRRLPSGGLALPLDDCAPRAWLPARRASWALLPLYVREEDLGYLLLEARGAEEGGPAGLGALLEEARGYTASAVKGALLSERTEAARRRAEEAELSAARLLGDLAAHLRGPVRALIAPGGASVGPMGAPAVSSVAFEPAAVLPGLKAALRIAELAEAGLDSGTTRLERRECAELFAAAFGPGKGLTIPGLRCELDACLPSIEVDIQRLAPALRALAEDLLAEGALGIAARATLDGPWLKIRLLAEAESGAALDRVARAEGSAVFGAAERIVRGQGGRIEPEAEAYTVLLPTRDAASPAPQARSGPILLVDDEELGAAALAQALRERMPGRRVSLAASPQAALALARRDPPACVVVDREIQGGGGRAVLEALRADEALAAVPVLMLSGEAIEDAEARALGSHAALILQARGVWTAQECADAVADLIAGRLGAHPGALVKRALAWITRYYARPVTRWKLAEAVCASEDHLTRCFRRELGMGPWDFLNRYRIREACRLLSGGDESIGEVAAAVGLGDQAYFSRVFRKVVHLSPREWRDRLRMPESSK